MTPSVTKTLGTATHSHFRVTFNFGGLNTHGVDMDLNFAGTFEVEGTGLWLGDVFQKTADAVRLYHNDPSEKSAWRLLAVRESRADMLASRIAGGVIAITSRDVKVVDAMVEPLS
jgi:hypothetical protein